MNLLYLKHIEMRKEYQLKLSEELYNALIDDFNYYNPSSYICNTTLEYKVNINDKFKI